MRRRRFADAYRTLSVVVVDRGICSGNAVVP